MPPESGENTALLRKIEAMQAQINQLTEQLAMKTQQLDDIRRIIDIPGSRCEVGASRADDDRSPAGLVIDDDWKGIVTPKDSVWSPDDTQNQSSSKATNSNLEPLGRRISAKWEADEEDSICLFPKDNFDDDDDDNDGNSDNGYGGYTDKARRRQSSPMSPRSARSAYSSKGRRRNSKSRSPDRRGSRGYDRSPNRRHSELYFWEDRRGSSYRSTQNHRIGTPASKKGHNSKWQVYDSTSLDNACGVLDQSEQPTMPSSVNQITGARPLPSSSDKVIAWRSDNAGSRVWDDQDEDKKSENSPAISNHSLTSHRLADASDEDGALYDPADDSSDDSDGALVSLRSKPTAAVRQVSIPQCNDITGKPVAGGTLMSLWSICAWASLNGLEDTYRLIYRNRLCTDSSRGKLKTVIKGLPRIEKRKVRFNGQELILYFKSGNHLKQTADMQRVHVWKPVPQAVLFYYLVTTVLQPLDHNQANTICSLWKDEFKISPVGIATVLDAMGHGWTEWSDMADLWKAACDWLSQLAVDVIKFGKAYVVSLTDKSGWSSIDANLCANAHKLPVDNDLTYSMVFGLLQTEVIDILKISPILLSSMWVSSQIDILIDAL
ncbi:hypothetical protein IW150_000392 [Coemansia sp. RSA 2607]|nr:hypothetical protein IW150_000392 [Coemansia sp. RSA 2607]